MTNDNRSDAFKEGRNTATRFTPAVCPYAENTQAASDWTDGMLEGRSAFAWNVRGLVNLGASAKYINDAIATPLALGLAKGIFHLGAESPVFFRLGWIVNSHDGQIPALDVPGWYRIAKVVNYALAGREIDDLEPTTPLERIAFLEAKDFQIRIIGHPVPVDAKDRTFQTDLGIILPWMGGDSPQHAELIEKTPGA